MLEGEPDLAAAFELARRAIVHRALAVAAERGARDAQVHLLQLLHVARPRTALRGGEHVRATGIELQRAHRDAERARVVSGVQRECRGLGEQRRRFHGIAPATGQRLQPLQPVLEAGEGEQIASQLRDAAFGIETGGALPRLHRARGVACEVPQRRPEIAPCPRRPGSLCIRQGRQRLGARLDQRQLAVGAARRQRAVGGGQHRRGVRALGDGTRQRARRTVRVARRAPSLGDVDE